MTRFEFAQKLNGKLYLLNEQERRGIIDEYLDHIDIKMQNGKSEEQAIKDFGDIDELADEILQAYHIDKRAGTKSLDMFVKQGVDFISRGTERILNFTAGDLARLIVEFILLLLLLNFMKIPASICFGLLTSVFSWLPYSIYKALRRILRLVGGALMVALSFLIIYQFIKKRVFERSDSFSFTPGENRTQNKSYKSDANTYYTVPEDKKQENNFSQNAQNGYESKDFENFTKSFDRGIKRAGEYMKESAEIASDYLQSNLGRAGEEIKNGMARTSDFVLHMVYVFLKVTLTLYLWLPAAAVTLAFVCATVVVCFLYIFSGIGFFGVCLTMIGLSLVSGAVCVAVSKFIFGGKFKE